MVCSEMLGTGGDIPSRFEGAGGGSNRLVRGEVRIRDRAVGEKGQELNTGDIM